MEHRGVDYVRPSDLSLPMPDMPMRRWHPGRLVFTAGACPLVVKAAFEPFDPPSTLLGVAILGYPDPLVEIEAVALAPPPSEPASSP
jgi:hypothetical protein